MRSTKNSRLLLTLFAASLLAVAGLRAASFDEVPTYKTGALPSAAVVGDYNHDGIPDVATANSKDKSVSVLLGRAKGGFQTARNFPTGSGALEMAEGDLNGDGNLDLAVTDGGSAVNILFGNGDGTFSSPVSLPVLVGATGIQVADFNHDGKLDLVVASVGRGGAKGDVVIFLGHGDGTFAPARSLQKNKSPYRLAVADFNNDGNLDIAVSNDGTEGATLTVLLGRGDGTFTASNALEVGGNYDIAAGDLNGDGNADLVILRSDGFYAETLFGKGDGTFTPGGEFDFPTPPTHLRLADLNGDGKLDCVCATGGGVNIVLGDGAGGFGAPVSYGVGNLFVTLGDLNLDGKLDVIAGGAELIGIAYGNGDGTIVAPVQSTPDNNVFSIVAADFNGDGFADVVTTGYALPAGTVSLNDGQGHFTKRGHFGMLGAEAAVAGDFNNDGKMDVCATDLDNGISFFKGRGDGTLQPAVVTRVSGLAYFVASGDFNHDGNLDLAVSENNNRIGIFLGKGDGTFQPETDYPAGSYPQNIYAADFNGDGETDLVVANKDSDSVGVYLGKGDGTFQPAVTTAIKKPTYLAVADFNRDGKVDLVVSGNETRILTSKGDGTFSVTAPVTNLSGPVQAADIDGDGQPDVLVANGGLIYAAINDGGGTFRPLQAFFAGASSSGPFAVFDANGDGLPDIVAAKDAEITPLLNRGTK